MEKENKLIRWIKKHKKAIAAAVGGAALIGGGIALANHLSNMNSVQTLTDTFQTTTENNLISAEVTTTTVRQVATDPYEVSKHLRNLHEGWHPSAEKIASAAANGFELGEGQTWVDTFTKGTGAA